MVKEAIDSAMAARKEWERTPHEHRLGEQRYTVFIPVIGNCSDLMVGTELYTQSSVESSTGLGYYLILSCILGQDTFTLTAPLFTLVWANIFLRIIIQSCTV